MTDVAAQILAELEHQIYPLLGVTHGTAEHGYDCCGCSTTYRLYDDVYALVRRHQQDGPTQPTDAAEDHHDDPA